MRHGRRTFIRNCGALALASRVQYSGQNSTKASSTVVVDPQPLFEISPYLYMQFMEPLGITDSSVEAAWDYEIDDWRQDFIAVVKDLAPGTFS